MPRPDERPPVWHRIEVADYEHLAYALGHKNFVVARTPEDGFRTGDVVSIMAEGCDVVSRRIGWVTDLAVISGVAATPAGLAVLSLYEDDELPARTTSSFGALRGWA